MAAHDSASDALSLAQKQAREGDHLKASLSFITAWSHLPTAASASSSAPAPAPSSSASTSDGKDDTAALRSAIYCGFKSLFDEDSADGGVHGRLTLTPTAAPPSSTSSEEIGSGEWEELSHILDFYGAKCEEGSAVALICRGWFYDHCCACLHRDGSSMASRDVTGDGNGDNDGEEKKSEQDAEACETKYFNLAMSDFMRVIDMLEGTGEVQDSLLLAFSYYSSARMLISREEDENRLEKAIGHCTRALEIDPNFMLALFNRASTWFLMGSYDSALQDYTTIIERTNDPDAYCSRAQILKDQLFKYDQAMRDVNECLKLDPRNSTAYSTRASIYEARWQDYVTAFKDYCCAIECNSRNALALFGRGNIHMYRNESDLALADYDAALALEPLSQAYNNRGVLYEQSFHNIGQAYADYCAAVQCDDKNAEAYLNRGGLMHVYFHQIEEALEDYNRSIELDSMNAQAYNNRGSLHEEHFDDLAAAKSDFESALSLDKNNKKTRSNLDRVTKKLKQ